MAAQCAMLAARLREREEELMNVRRELVEAREEVTTYRAMKDWRDEEKGRQHSGWQRERQLLTDKVERMVQQQTSERKHHEDEAARLTTDIHTLLATIDQQHSATQQLEQHNTQQQLHIANLQSQLLVHETNLTASTTRESLLQQSITQLTHQLTQRLTHVQSEREGELRSMRLESEQTERLLQSQVAAVRVALLEAQADADVSRAKRLKQARQHERLQQESRERVQSMEKEREAERQRLAAAEAEVEESRARLAALHTESAEQTEQSQQERGKLSALLLESRHQLGELMSSNRKLQAELDIWQSHKEQDGKVSSTHIHTPIEPILPPAHISAAHMLPVLFSLSVLLCLRRISCSCSSSTVNCNERMRSCKARSKSSTPHSLLSNSTANNNNSNTKLHSLTSTNNSPSVHNISPLPTLN